MAMAMNKLCRMYDCIKAYRTACASSQLVVLIQTNYFGHIVNRIDFYQRIFHKKKLILIFTTLSLDSSVKDYFESDYSKIIVVPTFFWGKIQSKISYIFYQLTRVHGILNNYRTIVFNTDLVLQTNFESLPQAKVYNLEDNSSLVDYNSPCHQRITLHTLHNFELGLPDSCIEVVEKLLSEKFGSPLDINRIVGLKLRDVSYQSGHFHDHRRNAYHLDNYIPLINLLVRKGCLVIIDSKDPVDSVYHPNILEISQLPNKLRGLMRTYMLTKAKFVMQQHSGPIHMANIASVDNIIIDGFPLWQGSWRKEDFFIPQEVICKLTNQRLGLVTILQKHADLFMGKYDHSLYEFYPSRFDYIESCIWERENPQPQYYSTKVELSRARDVLKGLIPNYALNKYSLSQFPEKLVFEEIGTL
jgi:putative glycosyltransferase (TIGR04372 family)